MPADTLTERDLAILRHALGLQHRARPYRNFYVTVSSAEDCRQCEQLVARGIMRPLEQAARCGRLFRVSPEGLALLGVDPESMEA